MHYSPGYAEENEAQDTPQGQPPFMAYPGFPSQDPNVASMRWNPEQLVQDLHRRLGALEISVKDDGSWTYKPIKGIRAKLNLEGVQDVLTTIESAINPYTSLSNMTDEEANDLIRQILIDVAMSLVFNKNRYQIDDGDLGSVMRIVKPLVFSQIKRAVKGHESTVFHTSRVESNTNQHLTQQPLRRPGIWSRMMGRG